MEYYSGSAAEQIRVNAVGLILQGVVGFGMFWALRSDHGDWEQIRQSLPPNLQAHFDNCIDTASNLGTNEGLVPVQIEIGGRMVNVLVHAADANVLSTPREPVAR